MTFLEKTSKTNKFVKIFCEAFFIFKQIFSLRHPGVTVFSLKPERLFLSRRRED
jgi:hypothetical protein